MTATLMFNDERSISVLASNHARRYGLHVTANSVTDLGGSNDFRRNSAPITIAGAFFVSAISFYGGLRRSTLGCAGFLNLRSANPVQLATLLCLAAGRGGSHDSGAPTMQHALNPSVLSVELQKAYCVELLKTLLRYSSQPELSRITTAIEIEVARILANRFVPGLNDATYDVYRRFWLKGGDV
ncbi:hypothetical protein [Pseudomonas sp. D1-1]|uniref:hypothetical protein n=1 Tax=Pseudomonas sp. D1-1 TaxID=1040793 RepID=UPI003DA927C9